MKRVSSIPTEKVAPFLKECLRCGDKYYIMCLLGLSTGLRISDILGLRVSTVRRRPMQVVQKKTGKRKAIQLDENIYALIGQYIQNHSLKAKDYLIYSSNRVKSRPLSRGQAYNVVKFAAKMCGMSLVSPHSMRKTYAQMKFSESHDIMQIKELLNHEFVSTTLLYLIDDFSKLKI